MDIIYKLYPEIEKMSDADKIQALAGLYLGLDSVIDGKNKIIELYKELSPESVTKEVEARIFKYNYFG